MRRTTLFILGFAVASVASAQLPPSISKPIDAAKKATNATNAQTNAVNAEQNKPAAKPAAPASAPKTAAPKSAASTAAPAKPAATTPAKGGATKPAPAPAKSVSAAPAQGGGKPAIKEDSSKITFEREVFAYVPRETDPFASPIETGAIRPLVADLRVVGIIYDATGRNSVAVMRDMSTQEQYRAKVGQKLGRARVAQIKPQDVVLTIEEYGFSRSETLKLNTLTTQQTQQTKGKP